MAIELTHTWLLVEDMPRALSFYHDTLGLPVISDLGQYVELRVQAGDGFLLSLFERRAMREGEPGITINPVSGQHAVIVFTVEALDDYCAGLRAKGVVFESELTNHAEWGIRTAFLRDPDGNLLCLHSGIPAAD